MLLGSMLWEWNMLLRPVLREWDLLRPVFRSGLGELSLRYERWWFVLWFRVLPLLDSR